eukprot:jgi/Orpsp1_1/1190640/evm.model.d7180000080291.1
MESENNNQDIKGNDKVVEGINNTNDTTEPKDQINQTEINSEKNDEVPIIKINSNDTASSSSNQEKKNIVKKTRFEDDTIPLDYSDENKKIITDNRDNKDILNSANEEK